MRILCLTDLWTPFPGGAERFIANVCKQLATKGHDLTILTSYFKAFETDERLRLIIQDIGVYDRHGEGWNLIREIVRNTTPDVILTHHFFAHEFRNELPLCGKPIVQVIHNGNRLEYAKLAVFNSNYTYDHSNPHPQDMVIHPPAFQDVVAEHTGFAVGMIKPIEHKGIRFVYELVRSMRHRQFVILRGEWQDCEIIEHHPNLEFLEPVDDIRDFYTRCKVILMPSLSEDAGTVAQEAAINGLPCISSDTMGLKETNAGGIVLPLPLHLGDWIKAIDNLYGDDIYYSRIVTRQQEHLKSFGWDKKFTDFNERLCSLV